MVGIEHCSVMYCYAPNPGIYDDRLEMSFCDKECLTEYLTDDIENTIEWYVQMNVVEVDND